MTSSQYINQVICGDAVDVISEMPANLVTAMVTDPPYGLAFMGKDWDSSVPPMVFWREALRVCKPGAMLMAFGGTRTWHRLACSIEDAGWEIRDCLMWLYAAGFPKSLDIGKAIDKEAGTVREIIGTKVGLPGYSLAPDQGRNTYSPDGRNSDVECSITAPATPEAQQWDGYGTALKPSWEPILLAQKPLDGTYAHNAVEHGVAGLNIDGGRIGTSADMNPRDFDDRYRTSPKFTGRDYAGGAVQQLRSRTGVVPKGRWPANLLLTHSPDCEDGRCVEECPVRMLDEQSGTMKNGWYPGKRGKDRARNSYGNFSGQKNLGVNITSDSGGASRFFFCSKASSAERGHGNNHPTVKPLALMKYLLGMLRMPEHTLVLDLFAGSGTTLVACYELGIPFVGIEKEAEYVEIAKRRLAESTPSLFADNQAEMLSAHDDIDMKQTSILDAIEAAEQGSAQL